MWDIHSVEIGNCQQIDNLAQNISYQLNILNMAGLAITITGIDNSGNLILSDSGTTTANPGDTITWIVNSNSGVASITGIIDDSKNDLFHPDPAPFSSASWQGTINTIKYAKERKETYTINYLKIGDAKIYRCDPEIRVKP